jgi:hypothetical protein
VRHSGDSNSNDANVEISPQEISADPGATVSFGYSGNAWARPGAPSNIIGVVIGVEDKPLSVVYFGIPGVYPGQSFSGSLSFTAPSEAGKYRIFGIVAAQYTREDAERWYREHPELRFQLGTLTVEAAPPFQWWILALVGGLGGIIIIGSTIIYNEVVKKHVG